MKGLIGKIGRKKEQSSSSSGSSSSRYKRLSYDEGIRSYDNHHKQEIRRGYVPILVGISEEEQEKFMVPCKLIEHPCIVELLKLAANEFGYDQQGVIHIPCEPHHFRVVLDNISSNN